MAKKNISFRLLLVLCVLIFCTLEKSFSESTNDKTEIKLGLTLSGGGAKGLAHIGVLHVLDSLGMKVDLLTGTSMGSVVGGLYASGYSSAEIEEIAIKLDWESLFSSQVELGFTHPRRRESYGKFIVQLPLQNGRIILPTGAIEGQQLWNALGRLFFHVRNVDNFSHLPIPFACVATDVSNGEAVVMNSGDIVTAIRASMAIPSIFTTVSRNEKKLIDGGVVLNFPVSVVKEMGAGKVIGVNVSQGLRSSDELVTPVDIIYQMGFYLDAHNFKENLKLVDVFIEPDLTGLTASSFGDAKEIIERGKTAARSQIPALLQLKAQLSGSSTPTLSHKDIRSSNIFVVDSIQFTGLTNIRPWFVRNAIGVKKGDTLNLESITGIINHLYATDYFRKINYHFIPSENKMNGILEFGFDEKPFASIGTAIHYSSFTGVGLIGSLTTNKFLFYNTGAYLKVLIGEKPAIRAGVDIFTSDRHNSWFNIEGSGQYLIFPVYEYFRNLTDYQQSYFRTEASYQRLTGNNSYISGGFGWFYQQLTPKSVTPFYIKGHTHSKELFLRWKLNTLNRIAFPQHGTRIDIASIWFFDQKPSFSFDNPDGSVSRNLQDVDITINNYLQISFNWQSFISISPKNTMVFRIQRGYSTFYNQRFINMFNLGGTYPILRNQVTFAGLHEYQVLTKSVLVGSLGWQYNVWDSFFLSPTVNVGSFDFDMEMFTDSASGNFVIGGGLNLGYMSPVGPLEVSFTFSPQTNKVLAYLNLGWTF
jgi:NTE family protein